MAPRKKRTTSADRSKNKGKGQKKVTGKTPQSRANRQRTSTARVTRSGQGGGRGRVTNASQRTSTGSARVTGKPQLALPPGKKGGSLVKPKSQTSRQAAARVKAAKAAKGTKGGTRVGQPAGSANRMYGANVVNKAVKRATRATRLAKGAKLVKRGGRLAVGAYLADKGAKLLGRAADQKEWNRLSKELQARRNKNKPGFNKGPNRVRPTTPYYGPGGSPSGSGEGQARQRKPAGTSGVTSRKSGSSTTTSRRAAAPAAPKKAAAPKATPKKKTSGVSGVGPVASGRTYSVQVKGKSVMQQQADDLRKMREASKKRQAADKAKLKKSQSKKKKR